MSGSGRIVRLLAGVALGVVLVTGAAPDGRGASDATPDRQPAAGAAPVEAKGPTQVVVFDRLTRTSTVISNDASGRPGTSSSSRPSISADGSLVAFETDAAILPEDTDGAADIYLWDASTRTSSRVSVGSGNSQPDGASRDPSISGDGGVVAFTSRATNLTPENLSGGTTRVFAWRLASASISLVATGASGPGSGGSSAPSVSADGRVVAFEAVADNLVPGDTNGERDVFLHDLALDVTIRASVTTNGRQVGSQSRRPSVSGDGGAVAFNSTSSALDRPDANGARDVFVRDLPPAVQVAPDVLDYGVIPVLTPISLSSTVLSVGWTPVAIAPATLDGPDTGHFVISDDRCAGASLPYGASCVIEVAFIPTAPGPKSATLMITDTAPDSPQVVELTGGVPAAQVRLDPAVGPPGIVTVLRGLGFPPGAEVAVRWDRGMTQPMRPTVVGPDGSFAVAVLVYHNDRVGPRQLLITDPSGASQFPDRAEPFLVVPAPLQPPGSSALTYLAPELQPILVSR